jgi:hypothetical protein
VGYLARSTRPGFAALSATRTDGISVRRKRAVLNPHLN